MLPRPLVWLTGLFGEVTIRDGMYVAKLRGMTQRLQMTVGDVYALDCAADLASARWGGDLTTLEESSAVAAATSLTSFEAMLTQPTGWYDGGELTWTNGANGGQTVAVRRWDSAAGTLSLFLPALYPIQAGDAFAIRPSRDKSFGTCRAKFDNAVNFRGFPYVPGNDQLLRYPDAQS